MTNSSALERLQANLSYQFKDQSLLQRALTHRSFGASNNERLEFLGDGVLGLIIGEYLYRRFATQPEGQLTRLRALLVKGETLAGVARDLGVGECLVLGEGERKSGGQNRESILADAVESIIGGIYLEAGMDTCTEVTLGWFDSRITSLEIGETKDPKTRLQETLQRHGLALPDYSIVEVTGASHNQEISVVCRIVDLDITTRATAKNRKQAEKSAAIAALDEIQGRKL